MPTRTEHIPCVVCGVTRPLRISSPSRRREAEQTVCMACHLERIKGFASRTENIPCPCCGVPRPIKLTQLSMRTQAENRRCLACGTGRTDPDEMAIERLVAGQPVNATPAERREAVAYLTRRKLPARLIAERIGCTQRTVERHRARMAS